MCQLLQWEYKPSTGHLTLSCCGVAVHQWGRMRLLTTLLNSRVTIVIDPGAGSLDLNSFAADDNKAKMLGGRQADEGGECLCLCFFNDV